LRISRSSDMSRLRSGPQVLPRDPLELMQKHHHDTKPAQGTGAGKYSG